MKNKQAFTLIELLVVVLIIGILAAVALPQYQRAVDKARYTQAMTLMEKIWQAQQRYRLANGAYSRTFDVLDIDMPTPSLARTDSDGDYYFYKWGECWISIYGYVTCTVKLGSNSAAWYFGYHNTQARECWTQPAENKRANELCQAMTKKGSGSLNNGGAYKSYSF